MARLHRNNPATPEGKYPIVLRRDGSVVTDRHFTLFLKDPAAQAALNAYADEAERLGWDSAFVADLRRMANVECPELRAGSERGETRKSDPDAPLHRKDDPIVLAWARSVGCPSS